MKWDWWGGSKALQFHQNFRSFSDSYKQTKICSKDNANQTRTRQMARESNLPCCNGGQLKWDNPQLQVWLDTRLTQAEESASFTCCTLCWKNQSQPHMQSALVTGEYEGMQVGKIPRAAWHKQNVPRSMNGGSLYHIYDVLRKVLLITTKSNHSSVKNASGKYQGMLNK